MPSDTEYSISVGRVPPGNFEIPPEASITVRTKSDGGGAFGAADPRSVTVDVSTGSLVVRWTCAEGAADWVTLIGEERRRFSSWDQCPPNEALSPENRGIEADFGVLALGATYRLYFTRFPYYAPEAPYMCIVRDVHVPPVERHMSLDRVLRRARDPSGIEITPVSIPPFERYVFNYGECWLRPDAFP